MKIGLLLFSLLCTVIGLLAADPILDVLPASYGEVVFLRKECMGKLNIVAARITCDKWERLSICGGEATSIYLPDRKFEFQAFSHDPYETNSESTSCSSNALSVTVQKGKRIYIEVIPKFEGEKLHWVLNQISG